MQISAISSPFTEPSDLFETGGARGLPAHALRRLPAIKVSADTAVDEAGEALCCSVCLQDDLIISHRSCGVNRIADLVCRTYCDGLDSFIASSLNFINIKN